MLHKTQQAQKKRFKSQLPVIFEGGNLFGALSELQIDEKEHKELESKIRSTHDTTAVTLQQLKHDITTTQQKLLNEITNSAPGLKQDPDTSKAITQVKADFKEIEDTFERHKKTLEKMRYNERHLFTVIIQNAKHHHAYQQELLAFKNHLTNTLKSCAKKCYSIITGKIQPNEAPPIDVVNDETLIDILTNPDLTQFPLDAAEDENFAKTCSLALSPLKQCLFQYELKAEEKSAVMNTQESITSAFKQEFNTIFSGIAQIDEKNQLTVNTLESKSRTVSEIARLCRQIRDNANTFYNRKLNYSLYNPISVIKNEMLRFSYSCENPLYPLDVDSKELLAKNALEFEKLILDSCKLLKTECIQPFIEQLNLESNELSKLKYIIQKELTDIKKRFSSHTSPEGLRYRQYTCLFQSDPARFWPMMQPLLAEEKVARPKL